MRAYQYLLLVLCLLLASALYADISVSVDADQLAPDLWSYTYTVDNRAGAFPIYQFFLNQVAMPTVAGSPTGWLAAWGTFEDGYVSWYDENPARDLPVGSAWSSFTITSPYAPGMISYGGWADDGEDDVSFGGTVGGPSLEPSVPEPISLCLLGLAAGPAIAFGRRRRRTSKA